MVGLGESASRMSSTYIVVVRTNETQHEIGRLYQKTGNAKEKYTNSYYVDQFIVTGDTLCCGHSIRQADIIRNQ